jgi:predicted HAD superfamily Cof-like phosphohydrolase
MKKELEMVEKFNKSFKIPILEKPSLIDKKEYILRYDMIKEELEEYKQACENKDLVEISDAIGDMLYLLFGTCLAHGMQHKIKKIFEEIQRSNMTKLDENNNPIYRKDGKILKSKNYSKPDLKKILDN